MTEALYITVICVGGMLLLCLVLLKQKMEELTDKLIDAIKRENGTPPDAQGELPDDQLDIQYSITPMDPPKTLEWERVTSAGESTWQATVFHITSPTMHIHKYYQVKREGNWYAAYVHIDLGARATVSGIGDHKYVSSLEARKACQNHHEGVYGH